VKFIHKKINQFQSCQIILARFKKPCQAPLEVLVPQITHLQNIDILNLMPKYILYQYF